MHGQQLLVRGLDVGLDLALWLLDQLWLQPHTSVFRAQQ